MFYLFFLFLLSCGNLEKTNELLEESLRLSGNFAKFYEKTGLKSEDIELHQLNSFFSFFKATLLFDFPKMLEHFKEAYGNIPDDVFFNFLYGISSTLSSFMENPFTNGE